jgi:hypothetical protein
LEEHEWPLSLRHFNFLPHVPVATVPEEDPFTVVGHSNVRKDNSWNTLIGEEVAIAFIESDAAD